jgi:hypothetical protein
MRSYEHTQRAPLCLLLYVVGGIMLVASFSLLNTPVIPWVMLVAGLSMVGLAASFHHLTVADEGDRLSIRFGPLPLFQRDVMYKDIVGAEPGRTTILDGWGIHMSMRGGWVWNLWGRDCVVLALRNGTLRIGTDQPEELAAFVNEQLSRIRP